MKTITDSELFVAAIKLIKTVVVWNVFLEASNFRRILFFIHFEQVACEVFS